MGARSVGSGTQAILTETQQPILGDELSKAQAKLRFWKGAPTVFVRDLTGHDERGVQDATTRSAVDLLQRLVDWPGESNARADELAAPDRDRLLAAVYQRAYGKKVQSTAVCGACSSPYDLSFFLDDLMAALDRSAESAASQVLPDGTFRMPSGLRFRLPAARDELEVSLLPSEEAEQALASRCLLEFPADEDSSTADSLKLLEAALEEVAPALDVDIDTACPECGARQMVRFDVQFYLLRAIEQERPQVALEVHRIASAYGWSLDEILTLGRAERRMLAQIIDGETAARRRVT